MPRRSISIEWRAELGMAGLLIVHAILLAWSASRNSVTFDEFAHMPAGLSYWRYGRFDVYDYTPPLPRLLGAWPALLGGARVPPIEAYLAMVPQERHWLYGDEFLKENREQYHHLFFLGRLALIPISCLGGWLVYLWARQLYGAIAGLLPCALYVFCPNILAHGSIVGTDTCTTVGMLAAAWAWWRFCRETNWHWWGIAIVSAAAAMLSKQTAILLLGAMLLIPLFVVSRKIVAWRRIAAAYAVALVLLLLLINLGYLFEGTGRRLDSFHMSSHRLQSVQGAMPAMRLPLPGPLIEGIDALNGELEGGIGAYVLGRVYNGSRWYYFPVALLCKLPLATLVVVAWAGLSLLGWIPPRRQATADEWAIFATSLLYLLFAMFLGRVNLGLRYILPVLPLAFVLTGRLWGPLMQWRLTAAHWAVLVLAAGTLLETLTAAPRFLSFINIAWGGSANGYKIVNDSSFDWGQSLIELNEWMSDCGVKRVHLAYFGSVEPSVYGIDYVPLSEDSDDDYVAVSGFFLAGLPQRLHTKQGVTGIASIEFYRELQEKTPAATVGSIYVFTRSDYRAAAIQHAR